MWGNTSPILIYSHNYCNNNCLERMLVDPGRIPYASRHRKEYEERHPSKHAKEPPTLPQGQRPGLDLNSPERQPGVNVSPIFSKDLLPCQRKCPRRHQRRPREFSQSEPLIPPSIKPKCLRLGVGEQRNSYGTRSITAPLLPNTLLGESAVLREIPLRRKLEMRTSR